jgi:hypothetical protein
MEDISFPLVMITFSALLAAQIYIPRLPGTLRLVLALLVLGLGLAGLFWPIRVPISHELLVAFRVVAVIPAIALCAVATVRVMSRAVADGNARGS